MAAIPSIESIKPTDLPVPPETTMQVMRACSHSDVDQRELSALIEHDPLLSAELLRLVNSPFYGFSYQVKSISRAVNLLGHRALRNLALCIAVRDILLNRRIDGFDLTPYWEDSLRRSVAARLLGQSIGMDAEECFTAGLLQDVGILVLFYQQPEKASHWPKIRSLDPERRYAQEQVLFGTTHDRVVEKLGRTWGLPEELVEALGQHHRGLNTDGAHHPLTLSTVLYCADWAASVFISGDTQTAVDRCRNRLSVKLNMDPEQVDTYLSQVPDQALQAATALGLKIRPLEDFNTILGKAHLRLAEENLNYQDLIWRLEKALRERDALAAELDQEFALARDMQRSLLPGAMPADFPAVGINRPARQLSGDFFDYYCLKDGRIYFNLADVSGKGMNAALLMAKTSSLFRCLGKQIHNPGKLLAYINDEIYETTTHGMFVSMIAGLFNPRDGDLRIVNAGHPPALLFSPSGKTISVSAFAPPLGIEPETGFPEINLTLRGEELFIYSDGVIESQSPSGSALGIDGLIELISEFATQPPHQRLQSIVDRLTPDGHLPRDDITLLLLRSIIA